MISVLTENDLVQKLQQRVNAKAGAYFAMYSSLWSGIVLDPRWMLIPIDDHMVHRGDGVFEAIKYVEGKAYLLEPHLERLMKSAEAIGLKPFASLQKLREIVLETTRVAVEQSHINSGLLRVFMSRGPGSFSVNPYDTEGTQFFVIATALAAPAKDKFAKGVAIGRSQVAVKDSWMAQVKSCNYLPNVMMKKEAVDRGFEFMVSFDREGFLAESATENIVLVTSEGILVKPRLQNILRGTTMTRTFELAQKLFAEGLLVGIESRDISVADLVSAREVMMMGTTLDVLPVTTFESEKISDGRVGPVAQRLLQLIQQDQR